MFFFFENEAQFNILQSGIMSLNEVVKMMRDKPDLDELMHITIDNLFFFISKLMRLLPELLSGKDDYIIIKSSICESIDAVLLSWRKFDLDTESFFNSWEEFYFWWEEFRKLFLNITSSNNIIYLYMN